VTPDHPGHPGAGMLRGRLLTLGLLYLVPVVLLLGTGLFAATAVLRHSFVLPFLVAGLGGASGAATVAAAALLAHRAITPSGLDTANHRTAQRLARAGRVTILASAAAALVVGVILAFTNDDPITDLALTVSAALIPAIVAISAGTIGRIIGGIPTAVPPQRPPATRLG